MNSEELQLLPIRSADGSVITIAYRFHEPQGDKPVFVWFCGFKSEMGSVKAAELSTWAKLNGAGCLRFDYSGHGKSGGQFEHGTISAWLDQAAAICERTVPQRPVVFVGSSMGAWIALLLARRLTLNLTGIALIAPAWDMTRLMLDRASDDARAALARDGIYYRPSEYGDEPYAITKALIDDGERHLFGNGPVPVNVPVKIIHGYKDADVPWRHSLVLLDVLKSEDMRLTLVKDGEHRLSRTQDLKLLFSTLAEFL